MAEMDNKTKARIDYLDVAKCIAIIAVVFGHVYRYPDLRMDYSPYIYTFHMPLFFMASGIVISRHRHEYDKAHWLSFFKKNALALLVPYFIWALIYSEFKLSNIPYILYASRYSLKAAGGITVVWFLPALFLARTFAEVILMISWKFEKINRHLFAALCSVPFFAIGYLLPELEMCYPWTLKGAIVATGFVLLGYASKEHLLSISDRSYKFHFIWLAVYTAIFVGALISRHGDVPYIAFYLEQFPDPLFFFVSSFSGVGVALTLSIIIAKKFTGTKFVDAVLWIGRNTMGIYLIHYPILIELPKVFHALGCKDDSGFIFPIIYSAIAIAISIVMTKIINIFIPQILGKFKTTK